MSAAVAAVAALTGEESETDDAQAIGAATGSSEQAAPSEPPCVVDAARNFLRAAQKQACASCAPGLKQMLEILDRLRAGQGKAGDTEELERLGHETKQACQCAVGKTVPDPILNGLRDFRDEYEAHVAGRCPARKCKALIRYVVGGACIGCTICAQRCPVAAIPAQPYRRHTIDDALCICCDLCKKLCPVSAITIAPISPDSSS